MTKRSLVNFFCMTFINIRAVFLWCSGSIFFLLLSFIAVILFLFLSFRRLTTFRVIASRIVLFSFGVCCDFDNSGFCQSNEGVLVLSNHQSMYDQFILGAFWRRAIVAVYEKKFLKRFFIGYFLRKTGGVPISRVDHDSAMRTMNNLKAVFESGVLVGMMPEGTRSYDGKLLPFKSGPFHLAKQIGVKIVVVVMDKAYQAKTKGNWRLYPKRVKVRHAVTVTPEQYQDWTVEQLRDYVSDKMQAKLDSLNPESVR
jgi:1-acyl-sn-glycerol-3-phosphate acyltransferase